MILFVVWTICFCFLLLFDHSTAFNTIDHASFFSTSYYSVTGSTFNTVTFLGDSTRTMKITGVRSAFVLLPLGVPQGSVLGPMFVALHVASLLVHVLKTAFRCINERG